MNGYWKLRFSLLLALILCWGSTSSSAATIPWFNQDPAIKPDIPDHGISDAALAEGALCAHAASTNVIEYFDAHGYPNLMPDGQTAEQLMISLATGDYELTHRLGPAAGLNQFIRERGYQGRLEAHNLNPLTWDLILSEMRRGQLLLMSIMPVEGGVGHMVTVAGWDTTPNRQIGVHDINAPVAGSDHTGTTGSTDFYRMTIAGDGQMSFKYGGDKTYNVTRVTAVSPIPEPASGLALAVILLLAKSIRCRRD
jgi:hypothetical protein